MKRRTLFLFFLWLLALIVLGGTLVTAWGSSSYFEQRYSATTTITASNSTSFFNSEESYNRDSKYTFFPGENYTHQRTGQHYAGDESFSQYDPGETAPDGWSIAGGSNTLASVYDYWDGHNHTLLIEDYDLVSSNGGRMTIVPTGESEGSFSMWVNLNSTSANWVTFSLRSGGAPSIYFAIKGSNGEIQYYDGCTPGWVGSGSFIAQSTWAHLRVDWWASRYDIYLDQTRIAERICFYSGGPVAPCEFEYLANTDFTGTLHLDALDWNFTGGSVTNANYQFERANCTTERKEVALSSTSGVFNTTVIDVSNSNVTHCWDLGAEVDGEDSLTYQFAAYPLDFDISVANYSVRLGAVHLGSYAQVYARAENFTNINFAHWYSNITVTPVVTIKIVPGEFSISIEDDNENTDIAHLETDLGNNTIDRFLAGTRNDSIQVYFGDSVLLEAINCDWDVPWGHLGNSPVMYKAEFDGTWVDSSFDDHDIFTLRNQNNSASFDAAGVSLLSWDVQDSLGTTSLVDNAGSIVVPTQVGMERKLIPATGVICDNDVGVGLAYSFLTMSNGGTFDNPTTNTTVNWTIGFWLRSEIPPMESWSTEEICDVFFFTGGGGVGAGHEFHADFETYNSVESRGREHIDVDGPGISMSGCYEEDYHAKPLQRGTNGFSSFYFFSHELEESGDYEYFHCGVYEGRSNTMQYYKFQYDPTGDNPTGQARASVKIIGDYDNRQALSISDPILVGEGFQELFPACGPDEMGRFMSNVDELIAQSPVFAVSSDESEEFQSTVTCSTTLEVPFPKTDDLGSDWYLFSAVEINGSTNATYSTVCNTGNVLEDKTTWNSTYNGSHRPIADFSRENTTQYGSTVFVNASASTCYFEVEALVSNDGYYYAEITFTAGIESLFVVYALERIEPEDASDAFLNKVMDMVAPIIFVAVFPALAWSVTRDKVWSAVGFLIGVLVGMLSGTIPVGLGILGCVLGAGLIARVYGSGKGNREGTSETIGGID